MRTFKTITEDIISVWTKIPQRAIPYLEALRSFETTDPKAKCGTLSACEIVKSFLEDASISFTGVVADLLKRELRDMIE